MLKVTARVDKFGKTNEKAVLSNNEQTVFSRLGSYRSNDIAVMEPIKHSPIISDGSQTQQASTSEQVISTSTLEVIDEDGNDTVEEKIKELEDKKAVLITHCEGLRNTIDAYYREITKLEMIVYKWSQEVEILRKRTVLSKKLSNL